MRSLTPARRRRPEAQPREPAFPSAFAASLEHYRRTALAEGCAAETVRTQCQSVARFLACASSSTIREPAHLSRSDVEGWQRSLHQHRKRDGEPLSTGTQLAMLAGLKAWFRWLVRNGALSTSPAEALRLPRVPAILPSIILSSARIDAILALADTRTALGLRDRAMLETFYSSGIRRMELARLTLQDVDCAEELIMVRHGKGRKDRFVPLGARARSWIVRYLREARGRLATPASPDALFLDEFGQALRTRYLGDLVRRYLENAGVAARGSCHLFRHAMATHMLDNGADIRHIQAILGHARLETTQIYTRVSIKKLKEVHAATHPAGKAPPESSRG